MKHNKKMAMVNDSEIERVTEMGIKKEKKEFYEAGTLKNGKGVKSIAKNIYIADQKVSSS